MKKLTEPKIPVCSVKGALDTYKTESSSEYLPDTTSAKDTFSRPENDCAHLPEGKAGAIPVILSVCGYDDLCTEGYTELRDKTRQVLKGIKTAMPSTPLYLMSTLFTKSERLAAELALQEGYRLICVLPENIRKYRKEFAGGDAYCFERLYSLAEKTVEEPVCEAKPFGAKSGWRRRQAQLYMCKNSLMLLCLYDGEGDEDDSSTQTVKFMKNKASLNKDALSANDICGIIQITTPHEANKYIRDPYKVGVSFRNKQALRAVLERTEAFNAQALALTGSQTLSSENSNEGERTYSALSECAKTLYEKHNKKMNTAVNTMLILGCLALCLFSAFTLGKFTAALLCCAALVVVDIFLYSRIIKNKQSAQAGEYLLLSRAAMLNGALKECNIPYNIADAILYPAKKATPWITEGLKALELIYSDGDDNANCSEDDISAMKRFASKEENRHSLQAEKERAFAKRERVVRNITGAAAAVMFAVLVVFALRYPAAVPYTLGRSYIVILAPFVELTFGCLASVFAAATLKAAVSKHSILQGCHERLKELYEQTSLELECDGNAEEVFITSAVTDLSLTAAFCEKYAGLHR